MAQDRDQWRDELLVLFVQYLGSVIRHLVRR